jgi:dipeptidase
MKFLKHQILFFVLQITGLKVQVAKSCTNLIVTQGASSDGSILLAYNADDTELMGMLCHYPSTRTNGTGKMRKIYSWDNGDFLGEIPEANATFNLVGNANEYGLIITETSW